MHNASKETNLISQLGTETATEVYFREEHKARVLKPYHVEHNGAGKGLVPAHDKSLEHAESPKANLDVTQLQRLAKQLGCIGFTTHTGRLFVRLTEVESWVPSISSEEMLYTVSENTPPWHHIDILYDLQEELSKVRFESFSVEVEFSDNVPSDINIYICVFGGHSNLGGFYGGFQTQVGCPGDSHGQDRVASSPGVIFSRWGPALPQDVCFGSSESFREVDTYEGSFASVRHHYPWKKGRYKLCLVARSTTPEGTWVDCELQDIALESVCRLGGLLFRGNEPLKLGKSLYSFIEIYGPNERHLTPDFPRFTTIFREMKLNGSYVDPRVRALYYKESPLYVTASVVPSSGCDCGWEVMAQFGMPFRISSYGERTLREIEDNKIGTKASSSSR